MSPDAARVCMMCAQVEPGVWPELGDNDEQICEPCQHLPQHSSPSATKKSKLTLFIMQNVSDEESNDHFQCIHPTGLCCIAIILTQPDCDQSDS